MLVGRHFLYTLLGCPTERFLNNHLPRWNLKRALCPLTLAACRFYWLGLAWLSRGDLDFFIFSPTLKSDSLSSIYTLTHKFRKRNYIWILLTKIQSLLTVNGEFWMKSFCLSSFLCVISRFSWISQFVCIFRDIKLSTLMLLAYRICSQNYFF